MDLFNLYLSICVISIDTCTFSLFSFFLWISWCLLRAYMIWLKSESISIYLCHKLTVCLSLTLYLSFKNDLLATLFKSKLLHSEIRFCFLYWIFWETLRPTLLPLPHCAAMEYRRLRLRLLWFAAGVNVNSAALLILLRCYLSLCNMLLTACKHMLLRDI